MEEMPVDVKHIRAMVITVNITVTVETEIEELDKDSGDSIKEDDKNGMVDVICL